jgi:hypothetical protein
MKQFEAIVFKTNFIIVLLSFFQYSFSQQLKTYQGAYKEGTATYQYYENKNYERIFQGSFKYISDYVIVIGNYDNNKRVGRWTITKTLPDGDYFLIHLKGYKEVVTGNYINGDMDGLWSLKQIDEKTKKTIKNSQVYFKKGYLINTFKYYTEFGFNDYETINLSMNGKYDNKGNFDSTWVVNYKKNGIPFEDIRKFNNGILYFHIIRNLSDGEITKDIHDNLESLERFGDYLNDNFVELYSSIFDNWRRIKTPNSYDFENPVIHERSSDEKLLKLFRDQSDTTKEGN